MWAQFLGVRAGRGAGPGWAARARQSLSSRTATRSHQRLVSAGEVAAAAAEIEASPEPGSSSVAAFFDVDNTVMRGASIYYFARGLASHKLFTGRDLLRFGWQQLLFRARGSESSDHVHAAREAALAFVAGKPVDELVTLGEQIYDDLVAERIWHGTHTLARAHLQADQQVWLVTAAPVELANIIARRLNLTGALGTVSETEDGIYTGRLVGELMHGSAKAEAVRALGEREGLDLADCYAYSDSINDLPMLSLVGKPCAVNPDRDLREHAKRHGWRSYDFRVGRRAAILALSGAAGAGAVSGGVAAAIALRRRRDRWRAWRRLSG